MKKLLPALCLILLFSLCLTPLCFAAGEEDGELADAYVYCLENGMPKYWLDLSFTMADDPVLHCAFRSSDPTFYESCFILDLGSAVETEDAIEIHTVTDLRGFDHSAKFLRLALVPDGDAFVLDVVRDEKTLAGGTEDNILTGTYRMEPAGVGVHYDYCLDNGMLKYRLDLSGDDILLRAWFRSGDPSFYEEDFTLDTRTAEAEDDYMLTIHTVYHSTGADVSNWFESLTLSEVQGAILMNAKRDEKTLAGGTEDNILTGVYLFEPQSYLLPAHEGPYSPAELARWAQLYYFRETGFYPPEADAELESDGSVTVHLYEIVELDGLSHTATSAWYSLDAYGVGTDQITGDAVEIFG